MPMTSNSSTIIEERETIEVEPIHPGEILLEEFMKPLGLSQNRLARELDLPPNRIHDVVHGRRSITPDTAFRLACFFGTSPEFWLNLQQRYDLLRLERREGARLRARIRPLGTA